MATRMVTVMFTDMVDSTGLSARLGQDLGDEVRRSHFLALRRAAAQHDGREVKGLGDGIMVVFESASAALAAAVAAQQATERQNDSLPEPVGLRVGISAGEVTEEDGDLYGDSVVEASRLCAKADGGRILVRALVRILAGRRVAFSFTELGQLKLKGLPEPIETLELDWEPVGMAVDTVPLPPLLEVVEPVVVGRDEQLEELQKTFADAATGSRQVVVVGGEPGIGKTTLLSIFARRAHENGALVCYGRTEKDLGLPYQAFVQALDHFVTHAPADVLETHVEEHRGELARLIPSLVRQVPGCPPATTTDPDSEKYLTFGAVVGLLSLAAQEQPVLLVVEDLHWADWPTLQLLRHLTAVPELGAVMVVGTYRTTDIGPSHPLTETLATLRREPCVSRVEISGLSHASVNELVTTLAGHEIEDEEQLRLIESLTVETRGNPFFVREILRHLADSGGLVQNASGQWSVTETLRATGLPQSLQEVVTQRVVHLGQDAAQVLTYAAVMGGEIELGVLADVVGMDPESLLDLVEQAERAAILMEVPGRTSYVSFVHALVPAILYDSVSTARRCRIHRRIAEAIEVRHGGDPGRAAFLAHHWREARDHAKALEYARLAGLGALDALAPNEAARWLGDALALLQADDSPMLHCDLLVAYGTAQRQSGEPGFRETLLEASCLATELDDPDRMAAATLANSRGNWSVTGAVDLERVAALEAALAQASDQALAARLFAMIASERTFDASYEERVELLRRAKELVPPDDPATLVSVYNLVVEIVRHPRQLPQRLDDSTVSLSVARGLDDPVALFWAVGHRMRATFEAGFIGESDRLFNEMQAIASGIGEPALLWQARYALALRTLLHGDVQRGDQLAAEAFDLGESAGQPDALMYYLGQVDMSLWMQGRVHEVADALRQSMIEHPGVPGFRAALTRALVHGGQFEEATELVDEAREKSFGDIPEDLIWTHAITTYAEAVVLLEDAASAEILADLLRPYAEQIAFTGANTNGHIAHHLGALAIVLGNYGEAEDCFAIATRWNEAAEAPYMGCLTDIQWASMLQRRRQPGDSRRAEALLERAGALARANGFAGVLRDVEALKTLP
jgi:class 3 adenylate cyclase/tetratricopeptide (TPR) repeat protein